jgi:enoyl-CoA hydratase/carnithine racemase
MSEKVLYEKRGRIAYVTLNRPDAKNAVDPAMHEALLAIWSDFRDDADVDVAILSGAGGTFCAGADLKSFVPINYVDATPVRVREIVQTGLGGITRGMHRIPKPVIAAIDGWALAGGLELALACDLRVASENAKFGSFEARRGFHHGDGGITRLVNTCGTGVAMQLVLTAEPIDAERALMCNLISAVVPEEELLVAAEEIAGQILRNSQRAIRSAKETILDVVGKPLDEQLRLEGWNSYSCLDPAEASELLEQFYRRTDSGRERPEDESPL